MKDYTTILREHNLKATPQRLELLDIIGKYGHINIDDLYTEVKDRFPSISLATIYKNINSLVDATILEEVKIPNEKSVYEIIKDNHSHLVCKKCKEIIDIDIEVSTLEDTITKKYDFDVDQNAIIFTGICHKCR